MFNVNELGKVTYRQTAKDVQSGKIAPVQEENNFLESNTAWIKRHWEGADQPNSLTNRDWKLAPDLPNSATGLP